MKNTIKNNKNYHFTFLAFTAMTLFFGLTFSACSEKEDEGELITTVKLSISVAAGTPMVHTWQDLDGPGGNAPILPDTITLGQITPGGNAYLGIFPPPHKTLKISVLNVVFKNCFFIMMKVVVVLIL